MYYTQENSTQFSKHIHKREQLQRNYKELEQLGFLICGYTYNIKVLDIGTYSEEVGRDLYKRERLKPRENYSPYIGRPDLAGGQLWPFPGPPPSPSHPRIILHHKAKQSNNK